MALPVISQRPSSVTFPSHVHPQHRAAFAAVLRQIPMAVEALRQARAKRPPTPRSVFILDWDDTCCATSFLENCGFMADLDTRLDECAPDLALHLRVLESRVLSLLKTAVSLGTVLIVTNAGDGWVELSSSRFLPAVHSFLEYNYKLIKIISARARYVDAYRQHPLQWKALTFSDELRSMFASMPFPLQCLHVFVLGDSVGDQYAAHVAGQALSSAGLPLVLKVVKFLERPSIDQLCKELAVLLDHINAMTDHDGSFDVSMYKDSPHVQQQQMHQLHTALQHQHHQNQQEQTSQPQPSQQQQALSAATQAAIERRSSTQSATNVSPTSSESQHTAISHVTAMSPCAAAV